MRECSIQNCKGQHEAKGYCQKHYNRLVKHGSATYEPFDHRTSHKLYSTYKGMKSRCYNRNNVYYSYYGGRGITVCDRWLGADGFPNFVEDMGDRPDGFTLDRVDNDRGYSPDNCRWVDRTTQQINQRLSVKNSSGVKGVHLYKATGRWSAYIDFRGKREHVGYFPSKEEAIAARMRAEIERASN